MYSWLRNSILREYKSLCFKCKILKNILIMLFFILIKGNIGFSILFRWDIKEDKIFIDENCFEV